MIREVARQGLLPYGSFFSSTAPFGTPLAPAVLKFTLTFLVIIALPAKDAFNFVLDLASYPHLVLKPTCILEVFLTHFCKCRYSNVLCVSEYGDCGNGGPSQVFCHPSSKQRTSMSFCISWLVSSYSSCRGAYRHIHIESKLKCYRVPPEPGQGDVSFWYAT